MSKFQVGDLIELKITFTYFGGANGINVAYIDSPPYDTGLRIPAEEMLPEYIDNITPGQLIQVRVSKILYDTPYFSTVIEKETKKQRDTRVTKIENILSEKERDAKDKRLKIGKYSPKPKPQQNIYYSRTNQEEERMIEEQIREDAWDYSENH